MATDSIVQRAALLITPVLESRKMELVDLEYKREGRGNVLRLFIDKDGGVTLDDCADISREVDVLLEVEDLIPGAYNLEVSSPGLDRPLKKAADYERFKGRLGKIKMRDSIDPDQRGHQRKTFVGTLLGLEGEAVLLEQNDKKGGIVKLPFEDIEKAHLELEF
ncbi:MAG: ribosome maturation factor [Syntrophotaleaceae bacterium]